MNYFLSLFFIVCHGKASPDIELDPNQDLIKNMGPKHCIEDYYYIRKKPASNCKSEYAVIR
jgi:hypothetical protein